MHTRHTHVKHCPRCVHKACTLCLQLVHVPLSPCSLSPKAHVGRVEVALKKDDRDVGKRAHCWRRRPWGVDRVGLGIFQGECHPLVVAPLLATQARGGRLQPVLMRPTPQLSFKAWGRGGCWGGGVQPGVGGGVSAGGRGGLAGGWGG